MKADFFFDGHQHLKANLWLLITSLVTNMDDKNQTIIIWLADLFTACRGVHFVKISSTGGKFGVSSTPTLVFFKNKAPQFYSGMLFF